MGGLKKLKKLSRGSYFMVACPDLPPFPLPFLRTSCMHQTTANDQLQQTCCGTMVPSSQLCHAHTLALTPHCMDVKDMERMLDLSSASPRRGYERDGQGQKR